MLSILEWYWSTQPLEWDQTPGANDEWEREGCPTTTVKTVDCRVSDTTTSVSRQQSYQPPTTYINMPENSPTQLWQPMIPFTTIFWKIFIDKLADCREIHLTLYIYDPDYYQGVIIILLLLHYSLLLQTCQPNPQQAKGNWSDTLKKGEFFRAAGGISATKLNLQTKTTFLWSCLVSVSK